jgi:hypothetical protein
MWKLARTLANRVREFLEARRQSLLVSGRASEQDATYLIEQLADEQGWK